MTNERAKSELEQLYMMLSEEKKKALDVAFKAMEQSMPTMVYPQVDGITPTVVAQADGEKNCFNCKWYPDNDITKGFDEVCHKCSNSDKWEGLIKRVPWEDIAPPPKIPEAQADGEKTCGTCRNEDTYHCAECENKSDYEQAQADGDLISRAELLKALETWDRFGVDDTNSLFRLDNLSLPHYVAYIHYDDVVKCIKGMPSVAIPSAEPCENAISRQAVMDCFKKWQPYMATRLHEFEKELSELPSVAIPSAEPNTGHWIIIDDCEKFIAKCSECGQIEDSRMIGKYAYCHCGARMVEPQESEEV